MTISVLIVDDEHLVRTGLRLILEADSEMLVVGEAADGAEALRLARELRPDVVLMDVRMPRMDGLGATRLLAQSGVGGCHVLMLTTFDLDEYLYEAMRAGAGGFLLKSAPPEQLTNAVRIVASGETLLAPSLTRRLVETFVKRPPPGSGTPKELEALTERELDVVRLIARGLSNSEIADELVLSTGTVKTHVNRILTKLALRDRVQIVVAAYESGLVSAGDSSAPPSC